jgi:hypothetical protein
MLGVLITPNRVEELTCIELIWRWHVYVIEGCSITYLFESIPLNQFLGRTFIEKVGGGLGHLYLWLSTLAIFTLWNDMQCERRGPLSDSLTQSGLETKQTIKLITILMKLSLARLICLGWTSTMSNMTIFSLYYWLIQNHLKNSVTNLLTFKTFF